MVHGVVLQTGAPFSVKLDLVLILCSFCYFIHFAILLWTFKFFFHVDISDHATLWSMHVVERLASDYKPNLMYNIKFSNYGWEF